MEPKRKTLLEAVFIFPIPVMVIIPAAILYFARDIHWALGLSAPWAYIPVILGIVLMILGLALAIRTVRLFFNQGDGTPAPWSPPKNFVVLGPYRHVRNPMIAAVCGVLLGEAMILGSLGVFVWFALFFLVMHLFVILWEEPGLEKRFGEDYQRYKQNVRRWLPRFRPYSG